MSVFRLCVPEEWGWADTLEGRLDVTYSQTKNSEVLS